MFPGPVFHYELLTLSRRKRFYLLRFGFGLFLLFLVWTNDPRNHAYHGPEWDGELTIREAKSFAMGLFATIATTIICAVIVLTPANVAGIIADEKQRKTLHYLLASCLTSAEIVVGKLAARLVLLAVLLGLTVPILVLLSLFGGVDPYEVFIFGLCCTTTTLLIASASVLFSVYARKPLDAIAGVYGFVLFWLFGPGFLQFMLPAAGGVFAVAYEWLRHVNALIGSTSPFFVFFNTLRGFRGRQSWVEDFIWMAGIQTCFSTVMLAFAVLRLRPVFRKDGEAGRRRFKIPGANLRRFFPRRPCGDDAMLWKEMYFARNNARSRIIGVILFATATGFLGYGLYELGWDAFAEVLSYGYGADTPSTSRTNFNIFLRFAETSLLICWLMGLAAAGAGSLAGEREADTWISLMATPLTPEEILRGKMVGAFWATRWIGLLWGGMLLIGLIVGALHPLGALFSILATSAYLWFACALGTFFSLRARNSSRALLTSIFLLFVMNGFYLILFIPFRFEGAFPYFGVMPFIEVVSLATYQEMGTLFGKSSLGLDQSTSINILGTGVISCLTYASLGGVMSVYLLARFDDIMDRPRTISRSSLEPVGKAKAKMMDEEIVGL